MEARWNEPVLLAIMPDETHEILSARDAVDCMLRWPWRSEKSYRKAVRVCLFALVGEKHPVKARKAFVAAARDADYLISA